MVEGQQAVAFSVTASVHIRGFKTPSSAYANHACSRLCQWLILSKRDVGEERPMAGNGRVGVALDVCAPLPTRRISVAGSDKFCLKALELLLGTKFIGLGSVSS